MIRGKVVHTGQIVVDIAVQVESVPLPGGDTFGDYAGMHAGGGFNVLYAARQTHVEAVYAGTMGMGAFADIAAKGLLEIGVPHVGPCVQADLGFCIAITDGSAERTFISTTGAEALQPIDCFDNLAVANEDVIYVSGYSLIHEMNGRAIERLLLRIADLPTKVYFDVSPVVGDIPDSALRSLCDVNPVWSVNEREAVILGQRCGIEFVDRMEVGELARLLGNCLGTVIVRAGSAGAWYCDGGSTRHVPSIPIDPVDTNGAGDAYSGVFCAAMARGENLDEALYWANIAGALSATQVGPATCPPLETIRNRVSG